MPKTLLISGSPRKGNSDFVLAEIFDRIDGEKEFLFLRDKEIKHCAGCLSCHEKPECAINDDMTEIGNKMIDSDVMIIATPNYFDNVSGLLKDFVDRTHPFYAAESLKGKKLILIMVGGGKIKGSQEALTNAMRGFVKYLKLHLVGTYCFEALHQNDLKQNPEAISKINEIFEKTVNKNKK
ncbi:flavodoxin family protein [Patescibacteria group bacterium]|nr:flavodoxin family protein [Patescibacteria group bacterium]